METHGSEHVLNGHDEPAPCLVHIAPQMMPEAWPAIAPLLERACAESRGEFTINRILANLENWPVLAIVKGEAVQAVMVTCITQYEDKRVMDCLLASGDQAKEWPAVDEAFDAFARGFGCSVLRIPCARKGWAKTLSHWKIRGYVMERAI